MFSVGENGNKYAQQESLHSALLGGDGRFWSGSVKDRENGMKLGLVSTAAAQVSKKNAIIGIAFK